MKLNLKFKNIYKAKFHVVVSRIFYKRNELKY
jgi:hypothetical protein